jgi:hypothetical protein
MSNFEKNESLPHVSSVDADKNFKSANVPAPKAAAPDPFDPTKLRITQSLGAAHGVKKHLTTLPVRKPSNEWYIRCHPDPAYHLETYVVDLKEDLETYLVVRELWDDLVGESTFSPRLILPAINRQGTLFLWPLKLPGPEGKPNEWNRSALEGANIAMKGWVRIRSNLNLQAYEIFEATGSLAEPEWPKIPFCDLLKIAFKDRVIDSLDHLVLKRLRGEI